MLVRALYLKGFNIVVKKSQLIPASSIHYCRLVINATLDSFVVSTSCLQFFKSLIVSPQWFSASALGYLAYWIFALGLSPITRLLVRNWHHSLVRILESESWPLPRPPKDVWASDTSDLYIAMVARVELH